MSEFSSRDVSIEELTTVLQDHGAERRRIIAVAGAPGSGKSTLAERLVDVLNGKAPGSAAVLPMDGYHFDDMVLEQRGLRARKGAPETFDVAGLRHALLRLKANEEPEIAVPVFDRDLEISRAGARIISCRVRNLIVEGNYLLLDRTPWSSLREIFDLSVMLDVPESVLRDRLTSRWERYDLSQQTVISKVENNDLPNGRLVRIASAPAQLILRS